jgi:S1-C subfamily serine protease
MSRSKLCVVGLAVTVVAGALGGMAAPPNKNETAALPKVVLPRDAGIGASPEQVARAALGLDSGPWKPGVNKERTRGPAAEVYARVAPAVVIVHTDTGHGTGALIDPAGWIVTNHHVIAEAPLDPETGAPRVTIRLGRLDDRFMRLLPEGVPGLVYKSSEEKDLALVKLTQMPSGFEKLPHLELAKKLPGPGSDCVAIGHPASGLLWTVRSGEVAGVGDWPREMTDLITAGLAASADEREKLGRLLAEARQRKIVLSTCGINFGDSGGPLVNGRGELIAVTFAMPKQQNRGTAKFSYHVHLDEVSAFVADRPRVPQVLAPGPWPAGVFSSLRDLDEDGTPDTLLFGAERGKEVTGMLLDLKQKTDRTFKPEELGSAEGRQKWRFQFALHLQPRIQAFYDTDDDGEFDLILIGKATEGAQNILRRVEGKWVHERGEGRRLIDPERIPAGAMRDRFVRIFRNLAK